MVTYRSNISKLESMGCTVEDWQLVDPAVGVLENEYWFTYDERLFMCTYVEDTIDDQLKHSTEYSICCNEEINDWRLCKRCKEHV